MLIALCLLGSPVGVVKAAIIFADNFEPASPLWGNESGAWSDSGGVYRSTSGSFAFSTTPFTLTDFAVDVDINYVWDGGIFLRSNYNGGAYNGVSLITGGEGGGGHGLYWLIWQNGVFNGVLNHSGPLFGSGADMHLRIEVVGDTYSAFLNGSATPVTSLTTGLYSSGQVALFNNKLGQSYDNFVISTTVPAPGAILLGGIGMGLVGWLRKRRAL
jgi:hypothetical protein